VYELKIKVYTLSNICFTKVKVKVKGGLVDKLYRPVWRGGSSDHIWSVHDWRRLNANCVGS